MRRAFNRYESTASAKAVREYWRLTMNRIGPEGRAYILRKSRPAWAMRILCEEVEGIQFTGASQ